MKLDLSKRFDGGATWATLPAEKQERIGAIALELLAAWWAQEQAADRYNGSDPMLRAANAADILLIEELREAMVDAVPREALEDAEGNPFIPSLLGPVCRVCGCSQEDGCAIGCGWAEPDLCTACIEEAGRG